MEVPSLDASFLLRALISASSSSSPLPPIIAPAEAAIEPYPEWEKALRAPRIAYILFAINRRDALNSFMDHEVSDLWIPIPKQTLRYFLKDSESEKRFLEVQKTLISHEWRGNQTPAPHQFFEDGEEVIRSEVTLGEGGFGMVERVTLSTNLNPTVCVRKRIGRVKQLNTQKQVMKAFTREVNVMRRVSHRHCVEFLGSYTDYDALAIFLSPVADMDLATHLNNGEVDIWDSFRLRQWISCLCNAMFYLHDRKIQHEDLKPQNILIHGVDILLTDFGFSLDFSEDSVSTTVGRPSHWTARYSAPEIIDHEARSRATDIWGLGCIFLEILSRIYGHRLSDMVDFWKMTGNTHSSYSLNEEARVEWIHHLTMTINHNFEEDYALLSLIISMLRRDRRVRPTAQQLVEKLLDLDLLFFGSLFPTQCCSPKPTRDRMFAILDRNRTMPSPVGHVHTEMSGRFTVIYADLSLYDSNSSYVPDIFKNGAELERTCRDLFRGTSTEVPFGNFNTPTPDPKQLDVVSKFEEMQLSDQVDTL
ncbi:kinase-like protein [Lojkania enalia]|uniref:Kinase-like protein n=1 Tax=Lojkania enalia TaxID=147567 RepID=A0A9P4N6J8_9PLEO|nr:kinase-like protein [Didymosphaeria enalia]